MYYLTSPYYALEFSTYNVYTSTNATSWTATSLSFRSLAYGNGVYVGTTGSNVQTSTDFSTWTTALTVGSQYVGFGDGKFVASNTTGSIRTSTDGTTWTTVSTGCGNSAVFDVMVIP
jgi:hypothetical protein